MSKLAVGDILVGNTNYLDNIRLANFPPGATWIRGHDRFQREFQAALVHPVDAPDDVVIAVWFQRYINGQLFVMCPSHRLGNTGAFRQAFPILTPKSDAFALMRGVPTRGFVRAETQPGQNRDSCPPWFQSRDRHTLVATNVGES